jgi:Mn-dependent DtxR family transcriptional regulator
MENYLEAVYELSEDGRGARLTDIAERLSVTKSTANAAMSTLSSRGLVDAGKYRRVLLTREGKKIAGAVAAKHKIIKRFFIEVLRMDEITADDDACAIEHVISDASLAAMDAFSEKALG